MKGIVAAIGMTLVTIGLIIGAMWGLPQYKVYSQEMRGSAALAEARQDRQIMIEQASAEKEAATLQAEAIEIVGQAAKDYPEYRTQQFIQSFGDALKRGDIDKIIYVPTEANIPITEAGK